jgi:hypothetical protein
MKTCKLEGCERKSQSKNYCHMHYMRVRSTGSPGSVEAKFKRNANPLPYCTLKGCYKPHVGLGYCSMHYRRFKKHGTTELIK